MLLCNPEPTRVIARDARYLIHGKAENYCNVTGTVSVCGDDPLTAAEIVSGGAELPPPQEVHKARNRPASGAIPAVLRRRTSRSKTGSMAAHMKDEPCRRLVWAGTVTETSIFTCD